MVSFVQSSCIQKQTEHPASKTTDNKKTFTDTIREYFSRNHWNYPIEIKIDTIHQEGVQLSKNLTVNIDTSILKKQLREWAMTTFTHNVEACLLKQFTVTNENANRFYFHCDIYYYRKRDLSDTDIVAPIEGHGIVDGSFYIRSERPYFSYDTKNLKFLHWLEKSKMRKY
jgi:hypothetical protein